MTVQKLPSVRRCAVVAILGAPLLWLSIAPTVAGVLERRQPGQALAWWPWSANAAATLSSELMSKSEPAPNAKYAGDLASQSLARQILSPVAARSLAIAMTYANPADPRVLQMMALSERMSRRDVPTQLWFIETAVQRGDVTGALRHYDRALRTSLSARMQILPTLIAAVNDPTIAHSLIPFLKRRPSWRDDFMTRLVTQGENPKSLSILIAASGLSPASANDRVLIERGIARIVEKGAPFLADRLYLRMGGLPLIAGTYVRNGNWAREPGLRPFDWALNDDPATTSVREEGEAGWKVHASLAAASSGWLARQLLIFPRGNYLVRARLAGPRNDGSTVTMSLRCIDGTSLLSQSRSEDDQITASVSVPSGCQGVWLAFDGHGPLDGATSDYMIGPVSVTRR